ncbi:Cytochrome P450 monooxygenase [Mycena sanguinolenta]|uniref:Cytochrome P450 monooxygenase n=1 Tax=Mycena sanguinolenta TaxID=230812 RepID=A0A8H6Z3D4_9AGAR|nr:Cytochrome P450 monooxygenase [Mycena sanguinolenta]
MDSSSEFLFNNCVDSLKTNLPYLHNVVSPPAQSNTREANAATKFMDAFNLVMMRISEREVVGPLWPVLEIFGDKTAGPMRDMSEYLDPIIHAAMEKKRLSGQKEKGGDSEELSLLDDLLDTTSAGRDTTMHILTVAIYFFTMYPDACARVREEILAQVGPSRRPNYEDIRDMKYLRAVLNETLRLYPSVPFNVRENINAVVWPSPDPNEKPLYIPAGTKVPYSVFMMHRRKVLWAEGFSPERFLDERLQTYFLKNNFQFLPFNAGPRICPVGQQLAYNKMSFMIVQLLQTFSSSLDEEGYKI